MRNPQDMPDLKHLVIYCRAMVHDRRTITQRIATQVLTIMVHPPPMVQIGFVNVQKVVIWVERNHAWIVPIQYRRSIHALEAFNGLGSPEETVIASVNAARLTHLEDEVASLSALPIWLQGFVSPGTRNDAYEEIPDFEDEIDEHRPRAPN